MGKLIPALEADLQRRRNNLIKRARDDFENNGQEYLGDDDDLLSDGDDDEGDVIPGEVAFSMFVRYKGLTDEQMDDKPDCWVFKERKIFNYMLTTGLLSRHAL